MTEIMPNSDAKTVSNQISVMILETGFQLKMNLLLLCLPISGISHNTNTPNSMPLLTTDVEKGNLFLYNMQVEFCSLLKAALV
jgi:hypothetical protein